jgi:hypothetical protein
VNDININNNVISSAGVQISAYNTLTNFNDYTQCDNWQDRNGTIFADDPTVGLPRNINFDTNRFYVNAGAISGAGRYVRVYHNTFMGYSGYPGGGGGTIEQETCGDQMMITGNNTLNGNGAPDTSGLELYSRNLTISGNTISGYIFEGIGLLSVNTASVSFNTLYNNSRSQEGHSDIQLASRSQQKGNCHPAPDAVPCDSTRDLTGVTVQNNSSDNAQYGIRMLALLGHGSTNNLNITSISGNTLAGPIGADGRATVNGSAVMNNPVISPPPTVTVQDPGVSDTIAIFPEGNQPLGAPLGTDDPGFGQQQAPSRRFFRFGANDPGGTQNLALIQGVLSTGACPSVGSPAHYPPQRGPGSGGPYFTPPSTASGSPCNPSGEQVGPSPALYYCSFAFDPPGNSGQSGGPTGTIYLDNTNPATAGQWLAGSSVLGPNGITLSNGACSIRATNSKMQESPANDLFVILDIEFLQPGTWFMYELSENNQFAFDLGNGQGNGAWSLWGYWKPGS